MPPLPLNNLIDSFLNVKSWRRGDVRAPHKPLLLMYALAKFSQGVKSLQYTIVEDDLRNLLRDFGPSRNVYRAEYPFWRLQKDNIWTVSTTAPVRENSSGDVSKVALTDTKATANFTPAIQEIFQEHPEYIITLIKELLSASFPSTIHEDILQSIGVELADVEGSTNRKTRCPKFREKVLRAYNYQCAVCGFDVRLGYTPIALEAAHIKWHQAGGPESVNNGIALCSLHHKMFDRGAFTLSEQLEILVSDRANGSHGFSEWLARFHGNKLNFPQSNRYMPQDNFLSWHTQEVFQGNYRDLN